MGESWGHSQLPSWGPPLASQHLAGKDDITSYEENTRPYLEACHSVSGQIDTLYP